MAHINFNKAVKRKVNHQCSMKVAHYGGIIKLITPTEERNQSFHRVI